MDIRLIRKINRAEQEIEGEVDAEAKDETDGKFGDKDALTPKVLHARVLRTPAEPERIIPNMQRFGWHTVWKLATHH